jgi:hypothetical protein
MATTYEDAIRETAARHGWTVTAEQDGRVLVVGDPGRPYEVKLPAEDGEARFERLPTVRHRLGGRAEAAYDARNEIVELASWYGEAGYRDVVAALKAHASEWRWRHELD